MNYYETLYIVHPALEAGRLKDIIISVEDTLKKSGGEPLALELWGKRKLSHYIDKQKYGTYVLLQYNGEGKCTGDFAVELEHNPNILAYLTTLIEKNDILIQKEDLDVQIAGKTREAEKNEPSKSIKEISLSKDVEANNTKEETIREESKKKDSNNLKTSDENKSTENKTDDISLVDNSVDEQTKSNDDQATEEEGETADDALKEEKNQLLEKEEETKPENADKTAAISKEE